MTQLKDALLGLDEHEPETVWTSGIRLVNKKAKTGTARVAIDKRAVDTARAIAADFPHIYELYEPPAEITLHEALNIARADGFSSLAGVDHCGHIVWQVAV